MVSSEHSSEDYHALVEAWITDALASGHTSFDQLVSALPGVYPSVVRDVLEQKGAQQPHSHDVQHQLAPSQLLENTFEHQIVLPTPHPLDYEWRFSSSAVAHLLNICRALAPPHAHIAFLGTPTVFQVAVEEHMPYRLALLENNPAVVTAFTRDTNETTIIRCDLTRDPLPRLVAGIVIADPPWYEDETRAFLWAGRQLCEDGGYIIMCMPPMGTRSGMEAERRRISGWAEQLGLRLLHQQRGALPYETPLFERNALRADGVRTELGTWRHGDLAIFKVMGSCAVARPIVPTLDGNWDEVTFGGVRIKLRRQEERVFHTPTLQPLVVGDVLPSVSRRDPRRAAADVWTSGNRIFSCQGTFVASAIAGALALGLPPVEQVSAHIGRPLQKNEVRLVDHASRQLYRVAAEERRELANGLRNIENVRSLYRRSS